MILVTGASGHIGRELVPQLLTAGEHVHVLVRDPKKVAHLDERVERVIGDLNKPESLATAMQGVDKVFLVTFETKQDVEVIKAAKQAGVSQIVKLSSLEATDHEIQIGKWHFEREEIIRASGLGYTFLRPGMFMTNLAEWWGDSIKAQGAVYFPGGKGKVAPIDPHDVAAVATKVLTEPGHNGQAYELTGDELLSMGEMVQVIGKALGKPLTYQNIPSLGARIFLLKNGMDKKLVNALMEMMAYLRANKGAVVTETTAQILGYRPRKFEAWCQAHINAFQN